MGSTNSKSANDPTLYHERTVVPNLQLNEDDLSVNRVTYSDSSRTSSFQKSARKLFSKEKKKSKSLDLRSMTLNSSISALNSPMLTPNICESYDIDPMIVAAEKLSARYDEQHSPHMSKNHSRECLKDKENTESSNALQPNNTFCTPKVMVQKNGSNQNISSGDCALLDQRPHSISGQNILFNMFLEKNTNETELRKEKERQQRMHYLLKRIWKGIYRVPLDHPKMIVNWCCGVGVWDMEMAMEFPDTQVIGVDFERALSMNLQHAIANLEFRHSIIDGDCTGLESFESNSVDFVMMRDVWLINTPAHKWNHILTESFRILKPGGWIEIEEHMLKIQSQNENLQKLDDYFDIFFTELQVDRAISKKLSTYLEKSGFVDIEEMSIAVPLGEWASTKDLKEIGYLSRDILGRRMRSLAKWVCGTNDLQHAQFNKLVNQSLEVEIDKSHSYLDWASYIARKPSL